MQSSVATAQLVSFDRATCAAIEAKMRSTGYPPLRHIHCEAVEGVVKLSGFVPTYFLKQLAQTIVLEEGRHIVIQNLLKVEPQRFSSAR